MNFGDAATTLSVHHDSWIRHQIRELVLHLDAPVETAELLQTALISLSQATACWRGAGEASAAVSRVGSGAVFGATQEVAFVAAVRQRVREDLADEIRQMIHLSLRQRRHWTLIKLAREHVRLRLQALGQDRPPTVEEVSRVTGLSVTEVDALQRLANLGPWEPQGGPQQVLELRVFKGSDDRQLAQARENTDIVLMHLAPLLAQCPVDRLALLQKHFGVSCCIGGRAVLPPVSMATSGWWMRLKSRWRPATRLDRRPRIPPATGGQREDLWPRRMTQLLRPYER